MVYLRASLICALCCSLSELTARERALLARRRALEEDMRRRRAALDDEERSVRGLERALRRGRDEQGAGHGDTRPAYPRTKY